MYTGKEQQNNAVLNTVLNKASGFVFITKNTNSMT